jgi:uncharacterized membrane protein
MSFNFAVAVLKLNYLSRIVLSVLLACVLYWCIPHEAMSALTHLILAWDAFCCCMLLMAWITFYRTPPKQIRQESIRQDDGRVIAFFIVLAATALSMLAVFLLMTGQGNHDVVQLGAALFCMLFSWLLVHTIYTLRYAHLYYSNDQDDPDQHLGGLDFPHEKHPDFLDFAYFAFTIGMTFQVSDIAITERKIRRISLGHALMSFGYNASIIALTVNALAGLSGQ